MSSKENTQIQLSKEKQDNLLSGYKHSEGVSEGDLEDDTSIDEFATNLRKTIDASEIGTAWIITIEPPSTNNSDTIRVQYMLKNGHKFWETYNYNKKYINKDTHPFIEIIESTGYNIDTLHMALGEQVDVSYCKSTNEYYTFVKDQYNSNSDANTTKNIDPSVSHFGPLVLQGSANTMIFKYAIITISVMALSMLAYVSSEFLYLGIVVFLVSLMFLID